MCRKVCSILCLNVLDPTPSALLLQSLDVIAMVLYNRNGFYVDYGWKVVQTFLA